MNRNGTDVSRQRDEAGQVWWGYIQCFLVTARERRMQTTMMGGRVSVSTT